LRKGSDDVFGQQITLVRAARPAATRMSGGRVGLSDL
jgi:hypothetical protein